MNGLKKAIATHKWRGVTLTPTVIATILECKNKGLKERTLTFSGPPCREYTKAECGELEKQLKRERVREKILENSMKIAFNISELEQQQKLGGSVHWVHKDRALCGILVDEEWQKTRSRHNVCSACRRIRKTIYKLQRRQEDRKYRERKKGG